MHFKLIGDYMEGYQERIKEIEARTLKKQKKNTQKKYSSKVYGTLCNIYCTTLTQIKILPLIQRVQFNFPLIINVYLERLNFVINPSLFRY